MLWPTTLMGTHVWSLQSWLAGSRAWISLFSCKAVSDSLRPHGLQYARLPCPSPSPGACSNSCPLSRWCHPTISFSVALFFCLESFPASRSFSMSRLFISGGQSTGASAAVLPMNIKGWFPSGLTGLISLQSKGLSKVFSSTTVQKHHFFGAQPSLWSNSHIRIWLMGNIVTLIRWTFVGKVMALLFKTLFRFVIACLPRSKCLNFVAAVTICSSFGAQEKKICHCFYLSPIYFHVLVAWGRISFQQRNLCYSPDGTGKMKQVTFCICSL